ncbi:hypothetical protein ACHHYP_05347 [Achlya hypogyna]|uniref:Secreted protein n=1 Tax=Achlya hypogyna TaxID=1202772 RepID=A0A0A7CN79_ACHHY|nr:secreted protein [Achlya hypogyna]OQR90650.1 hypothetical protein ACHHYP_05347 [Achlya hypogyna]
MVSLKAFICSLAVFVLGVSAADTSVNETEGVSSTSNFTESIFLEKAPTMCCPPRIRKSWDALTTEEKNTFKRAVALAMDKGLYERFVSMHREFASWGSAHNSCGYLFWHRQYLVGFENMLRSLKPEFGCLTLPYYDFVQDNLKLLSGKCSDIATCSSIVNELGSASPPGILPHISLINGFPVPGRCDKAEPLNHFCEWQNPASILCSHCVPRGKYQGAHFPCSASPSNLARVLFKSSGFKEMSRGLEWGPSLFMHFHLGGALGNAFVSPADPLFFPLHATIDALHTMYYNCRVRPLNLNDAGKQTHPLNFESCSIVGLFPITATSPITMKAITNGLTVVDVRSPTQVTAQFFKNLPNKQYLLADTTALNEHSYDYEFTGALAAMEKTCATTPPPTPVDPTSDLFFKWRAALSLQCSVQGLSSIECDLEIEKVLVLYYHNCVADGALDLSAAFKLEWGVSVVEDMLATLQKLLSGSLKIKLQTFGDINLKFFKCRGDAY